MPMKPFVNLTKEQNEPAVKRGNRVPDGAINLAWAQAPTLNPTSNVVVLDTSRTTPENAEDTQAKRKLMYANIHGVLEDINGNQLVDDEFPFVTDEFSVDEDFLTTPGSEYKDDDVLPFVHVSRYFHIDSPNLTLGSSLQPYHASQVKIVDGKGRDYVRPDGTRRYRTSITPAFITLPVTAVTAAYRLFVFVDDDTNEDLYLRYDKVEIDDVTGALKNAEVAYREILNPQPYFQNQPEESDVADPQNRKRKWYSSKPLSAKDQAIGSTTNPTQGYKIYVPRKAIGDPRIFQTFRWRVKCEFIQTYDVDQATKLQSINAGVVETGSATSMAPYVFLNLMQSQYNLNNVDFQNPVKSDHSLAQKETKAYWSVPFDTMSEEDLKKYDILFWAPNSIQYDFNPYLNKIRYFTETLGRTLVIDTANYMYPAGLMVTTTGPVDSTGAKYVAGATTGLVDTTTATYDLNSPLFKGEENLGGWDIPVDTLDMVSLSPYHDTEKPLGNNNVPYMQNVPNDYHAIMTSTITGSNPIAYAPELVHHTTSTNGNVIISTTGNYVSAGWIWAIDTPHLLDKNQSATRYSGTGYYHLINSYLIKGAMKLFYNTVLLSAKNKSINVAPTGQFSSSWIQTSSWKSDWVINAWNDVLSVEEKGMYNFSLRPRYSYDSTPVWQKRLSDKTMNQLINETLTDEDVKRLNGAVRVYTIETSNFQVKSTDGLQGTSPPYAWTEAYSPRFQVPVELGPNIIKEEHIHKQVASSQFVNYNYPPKPYNVSVNASYTTTTDHVVAEEVNWTATGVATVVNTIYSPPVVTQPSPTPSPTPTPTPAPPPAPPVVAPPPVSTPPSPPVASTPPTPTAQEVVLNWKDHGTSTFYTSPLYPEFGMPTPLGLSTWQEANYYNNAFGNGSQCWPHFGIEQKVQQGDSGDAVHLVQKSINAFKFWSFMDTGVGYLAEDGSYGPKTRSAVLAMQQTFQARYQDGIVDAESWGIIGSEVLRLASTLNALGKPLVDPTDSITHWWGDVQSNMDRRNASNGAAWNVYRKRSWFTGGPSVIWELFCVTFKQDYDIHGITITPYVLGNTNSIMFRSVHVTHMESNMQGAMMTDYDAARGQLTYMPHRPVHNQPFYLPVGPYHGNTIIIGVGQDGSSGYGTSRQLGIADVVAHATVVTSGVSASSPISSTIPAWKGSVPGFSNPQSYPATTVTLPWNGTTMTILTNPPTSVPKFDIYHNGVLYDTGGAYHGQNLYHGTPITIPASDQNGTYTIRLHGTSNDVASYTFTAVGASYSLTWDGTRLKVSSSDTIGYHLYHNGSGYSDWGYGGLIVYNGYSWLLPSADQHGTYTIRKGIPNEPFSGPASTIDLASYTFQEAAPPPAPTPSPPSTTTATANVTASGKAYVGSTPIVQNVVATVNIPGTLIAIHWTGVTSDSLDVNTTIQQTGLTTAKVTLTNHSVSVDVTGTNFTSGPNLSSSNNQSFYSMTINKTLNPGFETGYVSKSNGIKLICNQDKSPYGFPAFPSNSSIEQLSQRHFGNLTLTSSGSDHSVNYGFYDIRTKEFITNGGGQPTMTYLEYLTRGPQNIYVAVYSTYSQQTQDSLPTTDDAPSVPFRWAMPVYGIATRYSSHIGIEPLPPQLGAGDIWPVPIRTGSFSKVVSVHGRQKNPLTTYMKNYQGTDVKAFYSIPEAENGWSQIYGRPYTDIVDEEPLLLDDNVIQVRQPPFLMVQEPSIHATQADPLRAVFTVYKRDNLDAPWVTLDRTDIADYNSSDGTIYLKDPLPSADSNCVKVCYTTARANYNFKQVNSSRINLNPRLAKQNNLFGKPIYIYIIPHYVTSSDGIVIPESYTESTLRFTMDLDVFDPTNPQYDPLAVQLGIVYIVTNLDINNLVILDTRSRGGGAYPEAQLTDLKKSISDASGYWDVGDGSGKSYQKGGFVLIRLPEQLKQQFPNTSDIIDVIKRNITAGTQFKIETLTGGQW